MGSSGRYSILVEVQTGNAVAAINQLKGSLASLSTVGQPLGQASQQLDKISTSANTSSASLQRLVGTTGPLASNFSNAASRAGQLSGALGNIGTGASRAVGGLNQTNTLAGQAAGNMTKLATETEKASKSTIGMASNLRGMIIPIVGMGSAIVEAVGMFQAFQDVSKNVEDAQKKLNDAIKRYGEDSKQARDATNQLTDAQRGMQFILRNTIQSFSDIGIFAALMANSLLKMRTGVQTAGAAAGAAAPQMGALATGMGAINTASTGAVGGIGRFTAALRMIPAALGPIGLILTAVGAAIAAFTAAYASNFGGIRDITNDFGEAVGNAIPILRPFGDALAGIAGQLGLTGESVQQTAQHFRDATTGFQQMGALWEQTAQQVSDAFMEWGAAVQEGAGLVADGIADLFSQIGNQIGTWLADAAGRAQSAFQSTFGGLISAATDIASQIGAALSSVGQYIVDAGISTLETLGIDGNALVSQAQQVAQQIGAAFSGVGQTISDAVTKPLMAAQQPGAGGNVPGGSGIQDTSFMDQKVAEKLRQEDIDRAARAMPQTASEMGLVRGTPQTIEDLFPSGTTQPGLTLGGRGGAQMEGLSQLSSPQTLQGVRNLTPEINKYAESLKKTSAIDKALKQELDAQKKAGEEATFMWNELTNNGLNPAALRVTDLKSLMEGLPPEMALSEEALGRLTAAQQASNRVLDEGGTAAEAQQAALEILSQGYSLTGKEAEKVDTVMSKMRDTTKDLNTTLQQTGQAAVDGSLGLELQKQGTLEAKQAVLDYGSELVKNTAFNQEWGKAIETTAFQQAAFATGVQNQVAAMQQSKVAVMENAGALQQYGAQIASGESLNVAFVQGVQEVDRAFLESIDSIAQTQGAMNRYNDLLNEGKIQSVEFAKGQQEMIQSFQEMDASMANIEGQIQAFDQLLAAGDVSLKAWNLGLREGQLAARNWFTEMQQGSGQILGLEQGLRSLAGTLGVELPANIQLTAEQMQQLIAVSQGGVEAIRALEGSLAEMGNALTESLIVGFDDMDDALDDKLDEMEDKFEETFGTDMPETVRNALEQSGIDESFGNVAEQGLANMSAVFSDPAAFQDMGETLISSLEGQMDELSPRMQQAAQGVIDNIRAVLDDPSNAELWTNLTQSVENFQTAINEVDLASPFDTGREAAVRYSQEIDNIVSKITELNPQLAGFESDLAGLAANAPGTIAPLTQPTAAPTAPAAPDTAAVTAAVEQIKAKLAELGPATQAAVGQMNLAFSSVGQTWPAIVQGAITPVYQILTLLGPATQQAVGLMNAAFASVDLSGFLAALQPIYNVLVTLGPATQQAVAQMVAAFVAGTNQMITALQGVGNMALQTGTQIQTIGTAATTAAGVVNGATNTMITALQGVQNMSTQTAGSFAQIGEAANSAAQVVNSATNTMITALQGVISQAEAVASAIEGIGAAADSARSSVEELAAAINSLQDRTITITTRYVTTGTPPAGAAGGLGYYDGITYMAGGSGGVSGMGFAPIVIDHPTHLMVGESGPELVSVTPLNRNRNSKTGSLSPFIDPYSDKPRLRMQGGSMETEMGQGFQITTQSVIFDQNQGPIQIFQTAQGGGGALTPGGAGTPLGPGGGTFNVPGGQVSTMGNAVACVNGQCFGNPQGFGGQIPTGQTPMGQQGTFNVPGGQASVSGNAVACVNGQCFGNMAGFGPPTGTTPGTGLTGQQQQGFQPIFDELGNIKAIETLIEWFKFLGIASGASIPQTANFTQAGPTGAPVTGRGAFAQAGQGAFAGNISMQGGQIVFDSNQGKMQIDTSTGAISIAGPGGAFASAGGITATAGNVSMFGQDQTLQQLQQLNKTMQGVSGSMQAVGNAMASIGDEVVFGNQQIQNTFQGLNNNIQGLQTTTQQGFSGFQNAVINGVNLMGAGGQVGFQGFTLPNGQTGGAVGAGGASGNPLGFLSGMLGGFGINNPFQGAVPTTGGTPAGGTPGTIGTGGGGGSCSVCGAASGLQGAANQLGNAAGQLGNAAGQIPTGNTGGYGTGVPTTGGGFPSGGTGGGGGTLPPSGGGGGGGGPDCSCSCMPMDNPSGQNQFKIEDPSGRDCVNNQYFATMEECNSRLNEVKAGCGGNAPTPTPTPTTPTPTPTQPGMGGGVQMGPGVMASGSGACACANGICVGNCGGMGGAIGGVPGGGLGQPGFQMPIGNPPIPPSIVKSAGLPSQHQDVNQDPSSWRIIESKGLVGTYDIIDDNGDVVQLGFRTLSAAQEYLNYFISYYKWVKSGSSGIVKPGGGGGVQQGNFSTGGGAFASAGGGGGGNLGGIPSGNYGGGTGVPTGGGQLGGPNYGGGGQGLPSDFEGQFPTAPGQIGIGNNLGGGGQTAPPPTPPPINILEPDADTPAATTADKVNPANIDASYWKIAESTRPDGVLVYFVVVTVRGELTYITETPFATREDAQKYIDYWRQYQLYIANPPTTFPPGGQQPPGQVPPGQGGAPTFPGTGTGGGGVPMPPVNVGTGGVTATAGGATASAGPGGAFANAGGAQAFAGGGAGGKLGGGGFGPGEKKLGPTPVPDMPFEEIPRAQGPFRSGQDNQEPIYDNSRVKMGADVGDPGTVSLEDIEGGGGKPGYGKKPRGFSRIRDILQRHLNARVGVGGEYAELTNAIISAIMRGFENLGITFPVNVDLDGKSIYSSQKKYLGKEVSLYV